MVKQKATTESSGKMLRAPSKGRRPACKLFLMQVLRRDKRQSVSGQGLSRSVQCIVFVKVIYEKLRHQTFVDYVLLWHEVVEYV